MLVTLISAAVVGLVTAVFVQPAVRRADRRCCVGAVLPILFVMNRRTKRLNRFEEQFPEALDLLSRAVRAGHAFQTAHGHGRRRVDGAGRAGVQEDVRPAELRPAAAGRAERAGRAHRQPRRALLRDGRADPARDRRQPGGDSRQPGVRGARALQDSPPGPRAHRARPLHRVGAAVAAGGAGRGC